MSAPKLSQIGPYPVTRLIAEGGMAWVFEVVDPKFGVTRALKMLKPEAAAGEEFRRFQAEAQILVELDHPNLITIFDSDQDEATGYHYYTMSYIEGKSLAELLPMPFIQAGPMFLQVLAGLGRLHKAQIIHRDIKPANVMLTDDDRVLLCDLGIARATNDDKGLTRIGTAIGTFRYMAPEQAQGKTTDLTCDIFSMGLTMYEVIVGESFYDSLDLSDQGTAILFFLGQQVAAQTELDFKFPASMDPQVQAIIRRACSMQPEDRYADADTMHVAWTSMLEGQASAATIALVAPTVAVEVPQQPSQPKWDSGARWKLWLGAGLAAAVLAGGAVIFGPTFSQRELAPVEDTRELTESEVALRESPEPEVSLPEVVEEPPEPEPKATPPAAPFDRVVSLLRDRMAPWKQPRPRVRSTPEKLRLDDFYSLSLRAECDCWALLFAVDEIEREIWLLYPNQFQPASSLHAGEAIIVPPEGGKLGRFRAEGVERTDTLLMIVLPDPIPFPSYEIEGLWSATAEQPAHFSELEQFLQGLEGQRWASGLTYLEITAE